MAKAGPEAIKDIIEKVVVRLERTRGEKEQDIQAAWDDAVGRRAARHSQPVSLRKGILTIAVIEIMRIKVSGRLLINYARN